MTGSLVGIGILGIQANLGLEFVIIDLGLHFRMGLGRCLHYFSKRPKVKQTLHLTSEEQAHLLCSGLRQREQRFLKIEFEMGSKDWACNSGSFKPSESRRTRGEARTRSEEEFLLLGAKTHR